MLMNYYLDDSEVKVQLPADKEATPTTKRRRTEDARSRDSETETTKPKDKSSTLKPDTKKFNAYADIVGGCTVKTLARLIAQNYVDLAEGQRCHTPGCPRAPLTTIGDHEASRAPGPQNSEFWRASKTST